MPVQHRLLPDSELHEPKGAASAISGTVYVSDGSGSGDWTKIPATTLQGITSAATPNQQLVTDGLGGIKLVSGSTYGQIYYRASGSGSGQFSMVTWVPTTLANTVQNADKIQVNVTGVYVARFSGTFVPPSISDPLIYEAFLSIDGTNRVGNSSRNTSTAYCEAIVPMVAGQEMRVVVSPGTVLTTDGVLTLTYLGG